MKPSDSISKERLLFDNHILDYISRFYIILGCKFSLTKIYYMIFRLFKLS